MFIIGERINGMFRSVARAIAGARRGRDRRPRPPPGRGRRQRPRPQHRADRGRPGRGDAWLVGPSRTPWTCRSRSTARSPRSSRPGSPPPAGPAIINSTTGRQGPARRACCPWRPSTTPGLIAPDASTSAASRATPRRARRSPSTIVARALEAGISPDRLYLDPIVLPGQRRPGPVRGGARGDADLPVAVRARAASHRRPEQRVPGDGPPEPGQPDVPGHGHGHRARRARSSTRSTRSSWTRCGRRASCSTRRSMPRATSGRRPSPDGGRSRP